MNNFDPRWDRLTAAAREATVADVVPAPAPAWVTRVGGLGLAELRRTRTGAAWLAWTVPGFGVAALVAIAAVVVSRSVLVQREANVELVALADPFAGGSFLP